MKNPQPLEKNKTPLGVLLVFVLSIALFGALIAMSNWPFSTPPTAQDKARYAEGIARLERIKTAVEDYMAQTNHLPSRLEDLVPSQLPSVPLDPWGCKYRYFLYNDRAMIMFLGRDGKSGPTPRQVDRDVAVTVQGRP